MATGGVEIDIIDAVARTVSERFEYGRNFCNKLWNASRFAMMKIPGAPAWSLIKPRENLADRWIISRLKIGRAHV